MDSVRVFQSAFSIPIEIIIEILSRLPVKSLLRFKCVCKSWKSLISNAYFSHKHFDRMNNYSYHLLFTTSLEKQLQAVSIDSILNLKDHYLTDVTRKLPQLEEMDEIWPMGSCNGLVLLLSPSTSELLLLNPSTQKTRMLPDSSETVGDRAYNLFGFGYDRMSNDYKVVEICRPHPWKVLVYSLRKNSWKRIEDSPYIYPWFQSVLLDDSLVWFQTWDRTIISFDLDKEIFQQLPFPKDLNYPAPTKTAATLLACCAFILHTNTHANECPEGNATPCVQLPLSRSQIKDALVFKCITKGFAIFNMKKSTLTSALWDDTKLCRAEIYMESLVSVDGE